MGIKGYVINCYSNNKELTSQSIYGQIGPGERIALSKLAVEHYENHGRPLKLAIDISIWNFQTQSGKGGQNPVLRTLYYRLLRLLSLAIRPLFVFDGSNKPPFKRNKKTGYNAASLPDYLTKQLLKQFGFPFHTAPGEAEAECALLQHQGIVDAVLSEDVDTLMFGCGMTIRSWSSEGTKGNKTPTHVNLYRAEVTKETSGLDCEGMILVALMSGGDYVPAGIPGCGVKIACEAARAGFGKDLCKVSKNDRAGYKEWREWLEHELHTNESGHFRTKHKTLVIPDDFPKQDILGYYTNPVVSKLEKVLQLSLDVAWDKPINVPELRVFVAEAFQWWNLSGARKFIRGLAPALLVHQLQRKGVEDSKELKDVSEKEQEESQPIKAICGRRNHFITDGTTELRLAYIPVDIVGLNLELEEADNHTGQASSDSDAENAEENEQLDVPTTPRKTRAPARYDPTQPEKTWVLETYAKVGAPLVVETWEEEQRMPKKFATRKARERKQMARGGMEHGALDAYVKLTKPGIPHHPLSEPPSSFVETLGKGPLRRSNSNVVPPRVVTTATTGSPSKKGQTASTVMKNSHPPRERATTGDRSGPQATSTIDFAESTRSSLTNPWTLSRRPSDTFNAKLPSGTRYSALGVYASGSKDETTRAEQSGHDEKHLTMSMAPSGVSPSTLKKHVRPLSNSSLDGNVTVRRKRKAKPLTKAYTAPCGGREVIDLDSPDQSHMAKPPQRPIADPLRHLNEQPRILPTPQVDCHPKQSTSTPRDTQTDNEGWGSIRVNRIIDFGAQPSPIQASPASSVSLPSPSLLISKSVQGMPDRQQADADSLRALPSPSKEPRKAGKFVMLRDSLEGAWRDTEPSERARRPARVFSRVGVLDLTSD